MKNIVKIAAIALVGLSFTGCDDFINDNRFPLSVQTDNPTFWNSPDNVQNEINYFYNDFLGYGNGTGTGNFYFKWTTDDQCGRTTFANWLNLTASPSMSSWSASYTEIRRAYLIINGVSASSLTDSQKEDYLGQARLYLARQYYDLVRKFGDVPLIDEALDVNDVEALYAPRTDRNKVMDFVLENLDFAVANIGATSSKSKFSKDMAQAMKAEICLYEGSYAKYHQGDNTRAKKYFDEVIKAGEAISGKYPIVADYTSLYKSVQSEMNNNTEVIFSKQYVENVFMHSTMDYSCASDGIAGITRDAFDSFLMLDGTLPTDDKGEMTEDNNYISIQKLLDVRDQRLAMTTYPCLAFAGFTYAGPNTARMWSKSGYAVSKYDNFSFSNADATTANRGWTCAPLFWGARLNLAILEAKAETGTLDDAALTKYMKPLWDRAGFTVAPTVALLSAINDPANDVSVSNLIWEIRRCRRNELMMDDDIRYWDLVRWHMLDHMDTQKYPKIVQGANVSMVPQDKYPTEVSAVDPDYLDCSYGQSRIFHNRQYLYPIPTEQITIYRQHGVDLTQNPGWE
ncbi:MAG: RagB/SusD family nutrient uptake outer membrane protein [Muribaculaceae bacterium]|nr:RagB/SusD family nutrient uptake outer membrane protein [Muribaculaceae bacterium]